MPETVDARGMSCPEPVILTRNALKRSAEVVTIVDNATAELNVTKMAQNAGYVTRTERDGTDYRIVISKPGSTQETPGPLTAVSAISSGGPLVILAPGEHFGRGDAELGHILVRSFFHTLTEATERPASIVFLNGGVKLVVEGSDILDDLRALCDAGVEILACGTCLGFYGLKEKLAVGTVSNMYTIAETLTAAGRLIEL